MNSNSHYLPEVRTQNIVISEQKDELLIYCLETYKAYNLNKTAAAVYRMANGTKSIKEISDLLSRQLKSAMTEDFVIFCLNELRKKGLLDDSENTELKSIVLSRRDVIKQAAISTAAALPIITMLVAPKASAAQSVCGNEGDSCTGENPEFVPFFQGTCCNGLICCPDRVCGTNLCPV